MATVTRRPPVRDSPVHVELPEDLLLSIRDGNCIAFLGAGFTAPAGLPTWPELLSRLAERVEDTAVREHVQQKVSGGSSDGFEEAAQILEREMGKERLEDALRALLDGDVDAKEMNRRIRLLEGIPFRGILTTNFDGVLPGFVPGPEAYQTVLNTRSTTRSLFAQAMEHGRLDWRPPVLALHGDVKLPNSIVFSRLDYRRRLYRDPAYLGFLRSTFLFHTVLYLGFSFTDAYLNLIRSEILEMLGREPHDRPRAYAIVNDVNPLSRAHYREVEGIEILTYDSSNPENFGGFTGILERIHDETNPLARFGRLLDGRRILWATKDESNEHPTTKKVFPDAARAANCDECTVDFTSTAEEAISRLAEETYDLVVSCWGHHEPGGPLATQLLAYIRSSDVRVPLMVFASGDHADENKPATLAAGGIGYYHTWDGVIRGFEHVFACGSDGG
jgi:hypothetical protein